MGGTYCQSVKAYFKLISFIFFFGGGKGGGGGFVGAHNKGNILSVLRFFEFFSIMGESKLLFFIFFVMLDGVVLFFLGWILGCSFFPFCKRFCFGGFIFFFFFVGGGGRGWICMNMTIGIF